VARTTIAATARRTRWAGDGCGVVYMGIDSALVPDEPPLTAPSHRPHGARAWHASRR
jgi:hypothetical protein